MRRPFFLSGASGNLYTFWIHLILFSFSFSNPYNFIIIHNWREAFCSGSKPCESIELCYIKAVTDNKDRVDSSSCIRAKQLSLCTMTPWHWICKGCNDCLVKFHSWKYPRWNMWLILRGVQTELQSFITKQNKIHSKYLGWLIQRQCFYQSRFIVILRM